MEMYIEQGESRMDCELKIAARYNRPFQILGQKEIRIGGFLGLFSKPGVQVEFYFPQNRIPSNSMTMHSYNPRIPISLSAHEQNYKLEEEKKKLIAAARKNINEVSANGRETSQQILDTLMELKEKVENTGVSNRKFKDDHPAFLRAEELLKMNDFSENYINGILDKLRKEMSLEQLSNPDLVQDKILEWIGESISIFKEDEVPRKPRIMVLIGPTGVGKTTTISKLAAIYGIGTEEIPAVDVRMITIDAFRICAKEQLEQIGNIMQIPVSCVVNKHDLKKEIALYSNDIDLFFVDTIGKSPKDSIKLGEMKEILDGCPRHTEFHLVMSAATKTRDMEEIMRQFEPFNYKSIILTKTDETSHYGNIISALAEKRKCISYITDGQTVPVDIRRASVVRFLINLDGFKVNREKIEERFPSGEAEQFRWR
ncbi:MAG: flagellar biosynthesis protein FlhF [Treponema sp.]|nr:flagellar biosynthesis protein FlhF [Treponema sp.]